MKNIYFGEFSKKQYGSHLGDRHYEQTLSVQNADLAHCPEILAEKSLNSPNVDMKLIDRAALVHSLDYTKPNLILELLRTMQKVIL